MDRNYDEVFMDGHGDHGYLSVNESTFPNWLHSDSGFDLDPRQYPADGIHLHPPQSSAANAPYMNCDDSYNGVGLHYGFLGNQGEMVTSKGNIAMREMILEGSSSKKRRVKWTQEESSLLTDLVEIYGDKKWSFIAQKLRTKSTRQCREKWFNYLHPDIKNGPWSTEEENKLIDMHNIHGNNWTEIAKHIPGRPRNSIKNHFNAARYKVQRQRRAALKDCIKTPSPPPSSTTFTVDSTPFLDGTVFLDKTTDSPPLSSSPPHVSSDLNRCTEGTVLLDKTTDSPPLSSSPPHVSSDLNRCTEGTMFIDETTDSAALRSTPPYLSMDPNRFTEGTMFLDETTDFAALPSSPKHVTSDLTGNNESPNYPSMKDYFESLPLLSPSHYTFDPNYFQECTTDFTTLPMTAPSNLHFLMNGIGIDDNDGEMLLFGDSLW